MKKVPNNRKNVSLRDKFVTKHTTFQQCQNHRSNSNFYLKTLSQYEIFQVSF